MIFQCGVAMLLKQSPFELFSMFATGYEAQTQLQECCLEKQLQKCQKLERYYPKSDPQIPIEGKRR